jgi:riboflavin synthase
MFTGLVSDVGQVLDVRDTEGVRRFEIASRYPADSLQIGASVMHSGVCLTLVDIAPHGEGSRFAVQAVPETLSRTVLGSWTVGSRVNLERSLKVGDELGGHFVTGHIDGVGTVLGVRYEGGSHRVSIGFAPGLRGFIALKGSITVDGVSLTVAGVDRESEDVFDVVIIPHTWEVTTLGDVKVGTRVNLEIDILARYMARMLETGAAQAGRV